MSEPETPHPDLKFILFKRRGRFTLAACRGEAKGCKVMAKQRAKLGPCDECIICDNPDETLDQVRERIARGDA